MSFRWASSASRLRRRFSRRWRSVGLMLVREPLTAVVFQGGDFTAEDTRRVAFILLGYAPAIWAYSMTHTLTRAFYAKGDSMTPVKVAVAMVGLNLCLNLTLIWTPLREAGLAWSTATCAMIQTLILLRLARRHADHLIDHQVRLSWFKVIAMTAIMAVVVAGADAVLTPLPWIDRTWRSSVLRLLMLVGIGGAVVGAVSLLLRMPEMAWTMGRSGRPAGTQG
jgi:putative peptidoglycan lipid II flippase